VGAGMERFGFISNHVTESVGAKQTPCICNRRVSQCPLCKRNCSRGFAHAIEKCYFAAFSRAACGPLRARTESKRSTPRSEVEPQRELSEASFVVIAAQRDRVQSALLCDYGQWRANGSGRVLDGKRGFVHVQIVVVEQIECFCAELEIAAFSDPELLRHRRIVIPGARSAKRIASQHIRREGPEV
jgi:hypothetical protein